MADSAPLVAKPQLTADFLSSLAPSPIESHATASSEAGMRASAYFGLPAVFAYKNHPDPKFSKVSCGQAAIATLLDFWNAVPYPLPRVHPGLDGRKHYDGRQLLDVLMKDYPPIDIFWSAVRFTLRETILRALRDQGLRADEAFPAAFSNGEEVAVTLRNFIAQHRIPALCLIDLHEMNKTAQIWTPDSLSPYALHWAPVIGFTPQEVTLASWEQVFSVSWPAFMRGWHCPGVPHPNNYYAIYAGRPA